MNLFATVLTNAAPSANYRGESAENRAVIQKITKDRFEYAIISPEAMRNALREGLRALGLPCNRERLEDEEQLAVQFTTFPDAEKWADDFFMGWLVAAGSKDRTKYLKEIKEKEGRDPDAFTFKRDSILRMNMAVALEPYRHNTVFTQSPQQLNSPWQNAQNSQLLHRETVFTAYQYPFALNLEDCRKKPEWTRDLLRAIAQLNNVAGNHARSYFEMAPASVVVRLTSCLAAGYNTYGFEIADRTQTHLFPEVVEGILAGDFPGNEFYLGGKLVRDMDEKTSSALNQKGAVLDRNAARLLDLVGDQAFAAGEQP